MIPGINSRQMRQAMKRMGISQQELDDAVQVIIKCSGREIIISDPQVSKVNMMGQETWQVIGKAEERKLEVIPEITEEDIKTIMEQTGADKSKAKEALEKAKGDLAEAIISLNGE